MCLDELYTWLVNCQLKNFIMGNVQKHDIPAAET